jgi:hypothetical protein
VAQAHAGLSPDLNAARNLAALAELASLCLLAQILTGQPVDWPKLPVRPLDEPWLVGGWSLGQPVDWPKLPVRPYGWEPEQGTKQSARSSRGVPELEAKRPKEVPVRPAGPR